MKITRLPSKKTILSNLIFSLLMGSVIFVCRNAAIEHVLFSADISLLMEEAVYALLYTLLLFSVTFLIDSDIGAPEKESHFMQALRLPRFSLRNRRTFLLCAVLFFLAWLPYFIIYYPGLANFDTVNQVNDVWNGVNDIPFGFVNGQETVHAFLNDHHPVSVSLLFSAFFYLGELVGNPLPGMAAYVLCQMALGALAFTWMLKTMEEFDVRYTCRLLVFFFAALMPFIPFYLICMLKNTLHTLIFILYFLFHVCFVLKPELQTGKTRMLWILLSVLLVLTQKTGIYLILLNSFFLLCNKKTRHSVKKTLLSSAFLSALLIFLILPRFVFPALSIYPGGKQESMSPFFQQTARVVRDHEEKLSEQDKAVINAVLDYEKIKSDFDPECIDPVKATYRLHASSEQLKKYRQLWLRDGLRYPATYLKATLTVVGGFIAPLSKIGIFDQIPFGSNGYFDKIINTNPLSLMSVCTALFYRIEALPVLGFLFCNALYAFFIPMLCAYYAVRSKNRNVLLCMVPIAIWFLFMLVSPMIYSRYILPQIFLGGFLPCLFDMSGKSR